MDISFLFGFVVGVIVGAGFMIFLVELLTKT